MNSEGSRVVIGMTAFVGVGEDEIRLEVGKESGEITGELDQMLRGFIGCETCFHASPGGDTGDTGCSEYLSA